MNLHIQFIDSDNREVSVFLRKGDLQTYEQYGKIINVRIRDKYVSRCLMEESEAIRVAGELFAFMSQE